MAARPEQWRRFRADQARSADNSDLHVLASQPKAAANPAQHTKTSGKAPL